MRPKLLARFEGYVADMDDATAWIVTGEEQIETPLDNMPPAIRRRLRQGLVCRLLVYENRVAFRLVRTGRWTVRELKTVRREASRLYRMLRAAELARLATP